MAKNATLAGTRPEGEDRLLEDGVFPYVFGHCASEAGRGYEPIDVDTDAEKLPADGSSLVKRRVQQISDLAAWYHSVGTPYGHYMSHALQAQSRLLQSCCLRIATHHPEFKFTIPVFPWFTEQNKDWSELIKKGGPEAAPLEVLVKSLRTWSSLDQAIGALSGTATVTLRNARSPVVLLDRWLGGNQEVAISVPQGGSPDDLACPEQAGLPIGGNAVTLGAAKAAGFLYVYRLEQKAKDRGKELDGTPFYKASVFDLRTLALYDEASVGRRPRNETRLQTFLAASDLALFTPLHPMFASLRTGLRWNDLHPGHRLQRVLALVKERDLELKSYDPWAYWRFASAVCQALKWPEITRFLDLVRAKASEGPSDHMTELFRVACSQREVHPCAFIDPVEGTAHLEAIRPLHTRLAEFETSAEADRALWFGLEAELYAIGFQLLFGTEPPTLRCPAFKDAITHLASPEELTRTYYGIDL